MGAPAQGWWPSPPEFRARGVARGWPGARQGQDPPLPLSPLRAGKALDAGRLSTGGLDNSDKTGKRRRSGGQAVPPAQRPRDLASGKSRSRRSPHPSGGVDERVQSPAPCLSFLPTAGQTAARRPAPRARRAPRIPGVPVVTAARRARTRGDALSFCSRGHSQALPPVDPSRPLTESRPPRPPSPCRSGRRRRSPAGPSLEPPLPAVRSPPRTRVQPGVAPPASAHARPARLALRPPPPPR